MLYPTTRRFFPEILYYIPPFLVLFLAVITTVHATELGNDYSTDSMIELTEVTAHGDYIKKVINITTINGETTLTVNVDGNRTVTVMPLDVCENLWGYLMEKDVEYLEDAIGGSFPGSSTFTLKLKVGENSHIVTVEGVDSLVDTRSRDIVREIIRISDTYSPKE